MWIRDSGGIHAPRTAPMTTSKITNVKDGDLTAGSTDAVNGSQLKTTNDAVASQHHQYRHEHHQHHQPD